MSTAMITRIKIVGILPRFEIQRTELGDSEHRRSRRRVTQRRKRAAIVLDNRVGDFASTMDD
jgi:hypothetical protein